MLKIQNIYMLCYQLLQPIQLMFRWKISEKVSICKRTLGTCQRYSELGKTTSSSCSTWSAGLRSDCSKSRTLTSQPSKATKTSSKMPTSRDWTCSTWSSGTSRPRSTKSGRCGSTATSWSETTRRLPGRLVSRRSAILFFKVIVV